MRETIESSIRSAAAADPAFRAALTADPRAAIEERFGVAIPSSASIRIVEEQADEVVLVLPGQHSSELDDAMLEQVASGGYLSESGEPLPL
jgi:hypothetical protein